MAWFILIDAGVLKAVWAVALGKSEGLTRLAPSAVPLIVLAASAAGLGYAMRTLPTGTAYAVRVGISAAPTVAFGMVTDDESASPFKRYSAASPDSSSPTDRH